MKGTVQMLHEKEDLCAPRKIAGQNNLQILDGFFDKIRKQADKSYKDILSVGHGSHHNSPETRSSRITNRLQVRTFIRIQDGPNSDSFGKIGLLIKCRDSNQGFIIGTDLTTKNIR